LKYAIAIAFIGKLVPVNVIVSSLRTTAVTVYIEAWL